MPLTARVAGRTLLGLLALPEGGFRRDEVFAWMAGARIRHRGRPAPVAAWERLSRDAGVVAGREQWDRLLARYRRRADSEAEADRRKTPTRRSGGPVKADRSRSGPRAAHLRPGPRRRPHHGRVDTRRPGRSGHDGRTAPRWSLLGGERIAPHWPLVEQRAAERVERALDRLACLGEVEGPVGTRRLRPDPRARARGGPRPGRADGRGGAGRLRCSMGVGPRPRSGRRARPGRRGVPAPTTRRLPAARPRARSAGGELPLRAGRRAPASRAPRPLAGSSRQMLCVPRGDLRGGQERVPSRWVLQVASHTGRHRPGGPRTCCSTPTEANRGSSTLPPSTRACAASTFPASTRNTGLRSDARPRAATSRLVWSTVSSPRAPR